ncbi:MAG TPA: hypothetical protein VF681_04470 [Abditibacteriaceae bacterium]|jgi:hypothetical protein
MNTQEIEYGGWKRNLRLSNDEIELVVTLEVGPRIIHLAPLNGENLFYVFPGQLGKTGEAEWQNRGGHRLWIAPESNEDDPFTYFPDNAPVEYEVSGNSVRFWSPPELNNTRQKEIEISLDGVNVQVTHRVKNIGTESMMLAPWALSVMAPGGVAVVPQPPLGSHPENLAPNRTLIVWPFTDMTDPRLHFGSKFWTMAQDSTRGPVKLGLNHGAGIDGTGTSGWVAYVLNGVAFVKTIERDPNATYPDGNSNCELFTNKLMLEVESLGPLTTLAAGAQVEHRESWRIVPNIAAFSRNDDASIAAALSNL